MNAREIVQVRAKDFQTAVYVPAGLQEDTRYLVRTENLCPDCTTPMMILDGLDRDGEAGLLHLYHDVDCPLVRSVGGTTVSAADHCRVAETRRRYRDDDLAAWADWDEEV